MSAVTQEPVISVAGRAPAASDEPFLLRVDEARRESEGVLSFLLRAPDGAELPPWQPGAHIDVVLPSGLVRQYSLCGDPRERHTYQIAVLHEPDGRGGSRELHSRQLVGRDLRVRGPRNLFALGEAEAYLFVAGGIGITPLLPMLARVQHLGRPARLVYGGRTRASMAFLGRVVDLTWDVSVVPEDVAGRLDVAAELAGLAPGAAVYCCGPEGLLVAVEQECARLGLEQSLHVERFAAAPVVGGAATDGSFEVELQRSGRVLTVPADRSILEVVRDVDPDVPFSCDEGVCGTCETAVLAGVPEHRDAILTAAERAANDTMMICVSRCSGPGLVLDL